MRMHELEGVATLPGCEWFRRSGLDSNGRSQEYCWSLQVMIDM